MKAKTRFIQSVLKTSADQAIGPMPWSRGKPRKAQTTKRTEEIRKSA
ncbi:hypothetical protein HJ526_12550 [Donghicola sp. C2-DW-16]|uniref:Uncharacterized protein n=1 Tax=Donghicola mangrovi TaxID=2729614 RepID=A0ABX2PFH9_9RHOB|nr:hypothetical protein [Donghicola mangrovi]NVO28257.1 hypothetical protein [Donghicola mangrovi]